MSRHSYGQRANRCPSRQERSGFQCSLDALHAGRHQNSITGQEWAPEGEAADSEIRRAAISATEESHPGFIIICEACGDHLVAVDSDVGYSPESGGWGGVHLKCTCCGATVEIWSGY